ncbi:MAG: DUF6691 family protein [Hyphomicrobiaceae bacterium]
MNVLTAILIGLASGAVFGIALEKSRVFEPGVIVGQMQFRNFIMLKVFLAAVITGLVVLAVMNGVFGVPLHLKSLVWRADIIGGLLLGAGIALAGACPGTALAQIGAGYRDAWFVVAGGIAGAIFYGYFDKPIVAMLADKSQKLTFSGLAGVPFWSLALAVAAVLALFLVLLERMSPWQAEVGRDADGVMEAEADATQIGHGVAHKS